MSNFLLLKDNEIKGSIVCDRDRGRRLDTVMFLSDKSRSSSLAGETVVILSVQRTIRLELKIPFEYQSNKRKAIKNFKTIIFKLFLFTFNGSQWKTNFTLFLTDECTQYSTILQDYWSNLRADLWKMIGIALKSMYIPTRGILISSPDPVM